MTWSAIVGEPSDTFSDKFYLVRVKFPAQYQRDVTDKLKEVEADCATINCTVFLVSSAYSTDENDAELVWMTFTQSEASALFMQNGGEIKEFDWPAGYTDEDKLVNFWGVVHGLDVNWDVDPES